MKIAENIRTEQRHLDNYLALIAQLPKKDARPWECEAAVHASVRKIRSTQQELRQAMQHWKNASDAYESQLRDEKATVEAAEDAVKIARLELADKEETERVSQGAFTKAELLKLKSDEVAAEIALHNAKKKAKETQDIRDKVSNLDPETFDSKSLMVDPDIAARKILNLPTVESQNDDFRALLGPFESSQE